MRARSLADLMLLEDTYPPFGDALYPASIEIIDPTVARSGDGWLQAPPRDPSLHRVVFRAAGWCLTTIAAWFIILLTGAYPQGLYEFGVGALNWLLRVEAYVFLLVEDYPPFSLE